MPTAVVVILSWTIVVAQASCRLKMACFEQSVDSHKY